MFDIGFLELVIIGVVGLLVIGPERLPSAIRTGSLWLSRIRRGFNDIKQEVKQELHNDAVMQELRKTGEQLKEQTDGISQDIREAGRSITDTADRVDQPTRPDMAADPKPTASETLADDVMEPTANGNATGSDPQPGKGAG